MPLLAPSARARDGQQARQQARQQAGGNQFYDGRRSCLAGWVIQALRARRRPTRAARPCHAAATGHAAVGHVASRMAGPVAGRFTVWLAACLIACLASSTPAYADLLGFLPWMRARTYYDVDIEASPRELRKLLQTHLDISRFSTRPDVNEDQFEFLVTATPQQVRDLASTDGYFMPVVRTDVRTINGRRHVRVSVDAGQRTKISSVKLVFRGPVLTEDTAQENTARFAFSLHEGDPFTQSGWDDAKNASLKALQARRYLGAKIVQSEARIDPLTHDAQLSVTYDSGPTFTLGKIDVSGPQRYPGYIIDNVNPLTPGEVYDLNRVAELQRQVQNTPYYASVAIDVGNDVKNPLNTPVHVKVSEFPYNNFRGGTGYSTDTGVHVQGSYTYLNTFGAAWPFQVQGRLDQIQKFGQVQLSMPPGPRAWTNSIIASYTTTDVSDTNIYSARVGVQRTRTSQNIDYAYALTFFDDRLTQNVGPSSRAWALMPSWAWTRRNVDDPLFPRSGNIIRVEAGFAVKNVGAEQSFARAYMRGQQYLPIGRSDIMVFRAELGGVFTGGPSSGVPASLLFRAGGSNSVRGYAFQSIGNDQSGSILPTKYLVTSSAEYQHWFSHDWGGAAFFDVGTATDTWGEKEFDPGAGIGARWRSPVGPVNLDVAYGFRTHSVRPYLTLGIAF
jgi:translocation and assembly module TamA